MSGLETEFNNTGYTSPSLVTLIAVVAVRGSSGREGSSLCLASLAFKIEAFSKAKERAPQVQNSKTGIQIVYRPQYSNFEYKVYNQFQT